MQARTMVKVMAALLAAAGCGGGDTPETPDTSVPPVVDAGVPDAQTGACFSDLIDLDDPSVGQHTGNEIVYLGTVRAGDGELEPQGSCSGPTSNERVHKVTVGDRARIRATTISNQTPNLDSVIYFRTDCTDATSELACNDDAAGTVQSFAVTGEIATGTTVYIVVDSTVAQPVALPQPYQLTVTLDPIVSEGDPCDPTLQTNVCETGTVCSVAGGAPVCAAPLGGPTVTSLSARVRENGTSIEVSFTGTDPDGDIMQSLTTFTDASGAGIDFDGNGAPDEFFFTNLDPITGLLSVATGYELIGLSTATIDQIQGATLVLVDSANNRSPDFDAVVVHPTIAGLGDACGPATVECAGELACTGMLCTPTTAAVNACAAADATTGISAAGTYQVNIAPGAPDNFAGTCFWDTGLGESLLKITVPGPNSVRMTARTDVAPSSSMLDSYIYVRSACTDPASELACNDDIGSTSMGSQLASIITASLSPGTYYLVIDGSSTGGGWIADGDIGVQIDMVDLLGPGEACTLGVSECAPGYACGDVTGGTTTTCTALADLYTAMCANATPLTDGVAQTGTVYLTEPSFIEGSCAFANGFVERVYTLELATDSSVTLSTDGAGTNYDTVVYILDTCNPAGTEAACNDDIDPALPNWRSSLTTTLAAGTYFVVVDMSTPSLPDGTGAAANPSAFSLAVDITPM